jgi:hypothetical protein
VRNCSAIPAYKAVINTSARAMSKAVGAVLPRTASSASIVVRGYRVGCNAWIASAGTPRTSDARAGTHSDPAAPPAMSELVAIMRIVRGGSAAKQDGADQGVQQARQAGQDVSFMHLACARPARGSCAAVRTTLNFHYRPPNF